LGSYAKVPASRLNDPIGSALLSGAAVFQMVEGLISGYFRFANNTPKKTG
jgi:hypothetical protein